MNRATPTIAVLLCALSSVLCAAEFRSITPIQQPAAPTWIGANAASAEQSPELDRIVREARARVPDLARAGLQKLMDAWNQGNVDQYLADNFFDRQRFLDAIQSRVPRDARVRILAIESVQPLEQTNDLDRRDVLRLLVNTRVSAVVRTQIEYNDPRAGFQRVEGVNEFILQLRQVIPLREEGR